MRNLIALIQKYYHVVIFLVLEIYCFVLIQRNDSYQRTALVNFMGGVSGSILQKKADVEYYFRLKYINDSLMAENARLREALPANQFAQTRHDSLVRDTVSGKPMYKYFEAKVVNNSVTNPNNFIIINRGRNQGLKENMGVIGGNSGVVGRIVKVYSNYSAIMSVLHKDTKISAKLSDGTIGLVEWTDLDPEFVTLLNIPSHIKVKAGDTIYTSGYSTYPENQIIGFVAGKTKNTSNNMNDIKVKLATRFRNVQYVYAVEDLMGDERIKLEKAVKGDTLKK